MYDWVKTSVHNPLLPNAVWCGHDSYAGDLYIGRLRVGDEIVLLKYTKRFNQAHYALNGKEYTVAEFEMLVNLQGEKTEWVNCSGQSKLPKNAIQGGFTKSGQKLYVGRALGRVPGSVDPISKRISYASSWVENFSTEYEVLVHNFPTCCCCCSNEH